MTSGDQVGFELLRCHLDVGRLQKVRMSEGSEFHVVADATEKTHHVKSVCVLCIAGSKASIDCRRRIGSSHLTRLLVCNHSKMRCVHQSRRFVDNWRMYVTGWMPVLSSNHQCQSTKGNSKHSCQPHCFLTTEERATNCPTSVDQHCEHTPLTTRQHFYQLLINAESTMTMMMKMKQQTTVVKLRTDARRLHLQLAVMKLHPKVH